MYLTVIWPEGKLDRLVVSWYTRKGKQEDEARRVTPKSTEREEILSALKRGCIYPCC
jgi:hypothetical protein